MEEVVARGIPVGVLSLSSPQLASSKEGAWKLHLQRTEFDQQSHELESRFQELPLKSHLNWSLEWVWQYHKHRNKWSLPGLWSYVIGSCWFRSLTSCAFYRDSRKLKGGKFIIACHINADKVFKRKNKVWFSATLQIAKPRSILGGHLTNGRLAEWEWRSSRGMYQN